MSPHASIVDPARSDFPEASEAWLAVTAALGRLRSGDSEAAALDALRELRRARRLVGRAIDRLADDLAYRSAAQLELVDEWGS
jgi:hypothetical protein